MDRPIAFLIRGAIAVLQLLPLPWVARIGRLGGGVAYWIDTRHRRVAINNLKMCFGNEMSSGEIKKLARENFRRIGENYLSAVKTFTMSVEQMKPHLEIVGGGKAFAWREGGPISHVFAIGHFGNFELYTAIPQLSAEHSGATTYRALKGEAFNRLLLEYRERSGVRYFERRTQGAELRTALRSELLILGLLADQADRTHGVSVPFLGRDCGTSKAPAIYALRFDLPLHTAICYRTRLAHWRIEIGNEIPTRENGHPRSVEAIMTDVNRAFEIAVRRDPANWFWVHRRWKPALERARQAKPEMTTAT
jgi:KDO2-lipid IV(A) lauroyltransferase